MFHKKSNRIRKQLERQKAKREALRDKELFILDNSLRESTVGQLRGHTIENKWKIYEEIKKVGFQHIVVAAFSHMTRVGETFCRQLTEKGEDFSKFYAFSELFESIGKDKVPDTETIPVGLLKMKELGVRNPIIEADLAYQGIDYEKFDVKKICDLFSQRMNWVRENLSKDARIFFNIRDLPETMQINEKRLFKVIRYLSSLPPNERPFGLMYEEPRGIYLPEELGAWTAVVRKKMDDCGFKNGHLLVHVHEQWGLANMTQLECIINGATGIWASLCEEGAAVGHACSTITLMNMIRMGNKRVLKQYNCTELRRAAQNITKLTTGNDPHPKQPIYGERALDVVFNMGGMGGMESTGSKGISMPEQRDGCMAEFFGEKPVARITTLSTPQMIVDRLKDMFGEDPQFTVERAQEMLKVMLKDHHENRKEEYMSKVGLAVLFDRADGKLTKKISDVIAEEEPKSVHARRLIAEIREEWDKWDLREKVQKDDQLEFDSFYNGFMAPYFGCYRCEPTKLALKAIDMDEDGQVDWNEFALYLKWAVREYPETETSEELLSIAFRKGIIPAMQDAVC